MFLNYLDSICGFSIYNEILIFDYDSILTKGLLAEISDIYNHRIIEYVDVESFRYLFESEIKKSNRKYLIIVRTDIYVSYDIIKFFNCINISYRNIFPKLNPYVLKRSIIFDMDLLCISYQNLYQTMDSEHETKLFLLENIYTLDNITEYCKLIYEKIVKLLEVEDSYKKWQKIATLYAKLNYIKARFDYNLDTNIDNIIETYFKEFVLNNYKNLSSMSAYNGPVLINRCLDYIFMNSKKPAIIVMDCMSITDWLILSQHLDEISYQYNTTYALIPTITSISRQSLLSGKLPKELERPFSLEYEKRQFIEKSIENGFNQNEIKYNRGYDFDVGYMDKCICVIINDIDDLVHSQKQGNRGMYNDIELLSKSKKLYNIITKLIDRGFDVYITSDHGHKETITVGNPRGSGVEIESKSKRMLILKEFADYSNIIDEFKMIDYPGYYLPIDYKYLVCKENESLGNKGNIILSHGGISIEEVIVPFIKVKGVTNE